MKKYIAFLRGINVGGNNIIKMSDLKALFESLLFKNVSTYLQSGNVIFNSDNSNDEILRKAIEDKILEKLNLSVPIILRTQGDLEKIILNNPYLIKNIEGENKLYVTCLSKEADLKDVEKINEIESEADEFKIIGKEIYLFCPNGYGKTKFNNTFFEKKLKLTATTRNWNTINNLANNY
jgi:uncharacterized protein (DUF1697 family)